MKAKNAALALAMTASVGCTASRLAHLRRTSAADLPAYQYGSAGPGQIAQAKRCDLRVAVLSRPLGNRVLNEALWRVADEQAVPDELRRSLAANGLRIGLVPSTLPGEVNDVLNAPPPNKVDPAVVNLPSGENTLLPLGIATPKLSLMLNLDGHVTGRDYADAHGFLRLTASHEPAGGVALRIVPELQHGPVLHRYTSDDSSNAFAVQQFVMKDGQQEETIRDLAATLVVQSRQVAVVGCLPDRKRSLGYYLLTEPEANSDRLLQKVLLIWASQGGLEPIVAVQAPTEVGKKESAGKPGDTKGKSDRPR